MTLYEKQEQGEWGNSVVERLALDLQRGFPGTKGFSSRNLWRMKDLYKSYQGNEKLTTLSSEISWSHNVAFADIQRGKEYAELLSSQGISVKCSRPNYAYCPPITIVEGQKIGVA